MKLRPYQEDGIRACVQSYREGDTSGLLVLPTGAGKTIVFSSLIARSHGRVLVLVHRDELVRQSVEKLRSVNSNLDIGVVQARRNEHDKRVVVASIQTLCRPNRLNQVTPDFTLVVTDEAHHAIAASYRRIYDHVGAGAANGPYHLGVTATPARTDKHDLADVFKRIIYEIGMCDLIESGYLCDLRGKTIDLGVNLDRVKVRAGDFKPEQLTRAMIDAHAPKLIANAYLEYGAGRRAIAFLPGVEMAERVCKSLAVAGMASALVTAETPLNVRQETYAGLRAGTISVVSNCMVLTEGFDEPSVDCIIVGRPTTSLPLYMQMVGRGARLCAGKADCLIIDITGVSKRHKIQSLSDLFGVGMKPSRSYLEVQKERQKAPEGLSSDDIDAYFVDVDLFLASDLAWVQTQAGHLILGLGDFSYLCATFESGEWLLSHIVRGKPETMMARGPFSDVEAAAVSFMETHDSKWLIRKEAYWRSAPASDKQRQTLRTLSQLAEGAMTKGEASDLIASHVADRDIFEAKRLRGEIQLTHTRSESK
jgi:superfamily II DNA or RNA helicase